jgi:hypothetical protein
MFKIGREKREDKTYFNLADSSTLSKQHAQIFWDVQKQGFFIQNLCKNKIYVEHEELAEDKFSQKLENMTCIMISKIRFYFLLP